MKKILLLPVLLIVTLLSCSKESGEKDEQDAIPPTVVRLEFRCKTDLFTIQPSWYISPTNSGHTVFYNLKKGDVKVVDIQCGVAATISASVGYGDHAEKYIAFPYLDTGTKKIVELSYP